MHGIFIVRPKSRITSLLPDSPSLPRTCSYLCLARIPTMDQLHPSAPTCPDCNISRSLCYPTATPRAIECHSALFLISILISKADQVGVIQATPCGHDQVSVSGYRQFRKSSAMAFTLDVPVSLRSPFSAHLLIG